MDPFEVAKVVYNRIVKTESEDISRKIIGYIFLLDNADSEMIRLACGPDHLTQSLIQKAKIQLNLVANPVQFGPFLHLYRPFSTPATPQIRPVIPSPDLDPLLPHPNMVLENPMYQIQNQDQFVGLPDRFESFSRKVTNFSRDCYDPDGNFGVRGRTNENPIKICDFFNKGHCKDGSNCKDIHGRSESDNELIVDDEAESDNELMVDDEAAVSPGSLEKLESEITEILKSRWGSPISIASLPMVYFERYGRTLLAEGYLNKSQRQGKTGYSLTKLLGRLKNSIRIIERPHGQHSVVLAEDAPMFMENRYERMKSPGPIVSGSKHIYMTFPAESTFSEEDIANYFGIFGPVKVVKIPSQQNRTFGFVTFHYAETVQLILSRGNPHYVRGARLLVKPYREKLKLFERKYFDRFGAPVYYHSHHVDMDPDLQARLNCSRLFNWQLLVSKPEVSVQREMMCPSQLQLARRPSYLDDQTQSEGLNSSRLFNWQLVNEPKVSVKPETMPLSQLQLAGGPSSLDDQTQSKDQPENNSKSQSPKLATDLSDHTGDDIIYQDKSESSHGPDLCDEVD